MSSLRQSRPFSAVHDFSTGNPKPAYVDIIEYYILNVRLL